MPGSGEEAVKKMIKFLPFWSWQSSEGNREYSPGISQLHILLEEKMEQKACVVSISLTEKVTLE